MASPIPFPEANAILKAPPGYEDSVEDLHICHSVVEFPTTMPLPPGEGLPTKVKEDGSFVLEMPVVMSMWQFTPEEMEELNRNGGKMMASFTGITHPPFYVFIQEPQP